MNDSPRQITLEQWDARYQHLRHHGLSEPSYGGPLGRHVNQQGDYRLSCLLYDNSPAALRLWNFLLTEENRLRDARSQGKKIVGVMKDLGTVPIMAYALENLVAFYPDGAWWIPCVTQLNTRMLKIADSLGFNESFCPVRAMLGAFVSGDHFPIPDKLICSAGATCDDFSAIAQRLNDIGFPVFWWEIPHRRLPQPDEIPVPLPGGFSAPRCQVEFVKSQLNRVGIILEDLTGQKLDEDKLSAGIQKANLVRQYLAQLRHLVFTAPVCPMPSLELLIAEMLAIHFCSDRDETIAVLKQLLEEVEIRIRSGQGFLDSCAAKIFWVNPVADLRVMNLLEKSGGRICGTEYLFTHALDLIPTHLPHYEAIAQMALADPMVGSSTDRAARICSDVSRFSSEAVLISRIPGASHCAIEGQIIARIVRSRLDIPVLEIEVPPVADSVLPSIANRIESLVETVIRRRK